MAWGMEAAHLSDRGHGAGAARGNEEWERQRARLVVAANATGREDCAQLLEVLGLSSEERP